MRSISQSQNENATGISLWTLEDIEKAQAKQKAIEMEQRRALEDTTNRRKDQPMDVDDDDEYGDGGFDDHILGSIDLDV